MHKNETEPTSSDSGDCGPQSNGSAGWQWRKRSNKAAYVRSVGGLAAMDPQSYRLSLAGAGAGHISYGQPISRQLCHRAAWGTFDHYWTS